MQGFKSSNFRLNTCEKFPHIIAVKFRMNNQDAEVFPLLQVQGLVVDPIVGGGSGKDGVNVPIYRILLRLA